MYCHYHQLYNAVYSMCWGNVFPRKTSVKYFVVLILYVKDILHPILFPGLCSLLCMLIWIMSFHCVCPVDSSLGGRHKVLKEALSTSCTHTKCHILHCHLMAWCEAIPHLAGWGGKGWWKGCAGPILILLSNEKCLWKEGLMSLPY